MRVLVLDASAFLQGYTYSSTEAEQYTVPLVRGEVREEYASLRYAGAVSSGRLKETPPKEESLILVEAEVRRMGEAVLSETDRQILALALDLRAAGKQPTIVSDDYSVQNMAVRLGLGFQTQGTRGIRREISWIIYCPGCRKQFVAGRPGDECPVCGTALKRKPSRRGG